ncbi:MAG: hypothetical protein M3Y65_23330 [Pseudomonadota bacterium]|nr:hypothetical protein [Pseudomonadota bacterium]
MNKALSTSIFASAANQGDTAEMSAANAYLKMVTDQTQQTLGDTLGCTLSSIRSNGLGAFNWSYSNGQSTQINGATYNWVSAELDVADGNNMVCAGPADSFVTAYQSFIQGIYFQFSIADQTTLQKSQNAASTQSAALVAAFNTTFATPTATDYATATAAMSAYPPYGPSTEINFIIDYVMGKMWAGKGGPYSNVQMQNTASLSTLLTAAPANAGTVLPLASQYLVALGLGAALTDQGNLANMQIGAMKKNVLTPTAANGGMTVYNPQSNQPNNPTLPGYLVSPVPSQDPSLQTTKISATFSSSATSDSSWNVSYAGQAGISVGSFLNFSAGSSVTGDIASQCGASATMSVMVTYPNIVASPAISAIPQGLSTVAADGTATGWFSPQIAQQAYKNTKLGNDAPSGFAFIGGALPENFGYPSTIVVSGFPVISVTVTNGDYNAYQSWQKTQTSFNVSLFGIISLASGSVDTYTSTITSHQSNSSFTFQLSPPTKAPITNPAQQVYPVLGVGVTYLDV